MPHSFLHMPKNSVVGQLWDKLWAKANLSLRCFPWVILSHWQSYQHTILTQLCSLTHKTSRTCVSSILRSTVSTSDSQPWKAMNISTPPYSPSWWTRAQDQLWPPRAYGFVIIAILLHVIYEGFPITTVIEQQEEDVTIKTTEPWKSRKLSTWPLFDQLSFSP